MAYGLVHTGRSIKSDALQGMQKVKQNEDQREMRNDQIEMADKQQKTTNVSAGAGIGAMAASGAKAGAFAGPMGVVYGAAIGALAGWAASELF